MKARLPLLAAALFALVSAAPAKAETIAPGATYSQNFNAIGTSGTATLPSGWTANNSSNSAREVTKALYESAGSTTTQAGTGTGTSNGIWNFGDEGDSSDRGVGFLASTSGTKTGNLYLTLTASGAIPDFTVSYDMKCYRNNSNQFQFQMYYSTDGGDTWTSAGTSFCTTYATGTSGVVNPAGVTSVSGQSLNVSLSSGETIVFCWSYSVPSGSTTSNAQGLGIDNVVIVAGKNAGLEPLDTPTNLTASDNNPVGFALSWDAVADAIGYDVTVLDSSNASVGDIVINGTTATISGLASSSTYSVQVVALGNGTTTDSSDPATLSNIHTTAPTVLATPTGLASSNVGYFGFSLSWTAVSGATSYTVTLSPSAGSVEVSGTAATVTGLAEGETYTASVVAKGNGTTTVDSSAATLDVTTATAPAVSAPVLTATAVSSSAFTVSWPAQNDATFSVRAWTLVPADVATEDFAGYIANKTAPAGWDFENTLTPYGNYSEAPVDFRNNDEWVSSPVFSGTITEVRFHLRKQGTVGNGSTFTVYGSTGSNDPEVWKTAENMLASYTDNDIATTDYTIPIDASKGVTRVFFHYTKKSGNVSFGSFSVTGTGVGKQPSYLTGYGPDATAVAGTSVTISNPVAGEANYVEVTATGLSGKTASATIAVPVPAVATPKPAVISVK